MSDNILIDTSAFYALISTTDEFHERAIALYTGLLDQRANLYTTSYVMVECMALIHRRLGYPVLESFVNSLGAVVTILWIDRENHWQAWEILSGHQGRRLSFVDCTTLVLCKSLDAKLFAFDEDFVQEGLEVI